MSGKKDRILRKRYNKAADIYWTKDMEKMLRKIRKELIFWRFFGPALALFGLAWVLFEVIKK